MLYMTAQGSNATTQLELLLDPCGVQGYSMQRRNSCLGLQLL